MDSKRSNRIFNKQSSALLKPESLYPLVMLRVLFGAIMACWALNMLFNQDLMRLFAGNDFVFHYNGFDWIKSPGALCIYLIFGVIVLSSLFLGAGLFYKISTLIFTLSFSYVTLIDKSNYLSYFYFVIILAVMLLFSPAQRLFSLDLIRKPSIRVDYIPAWFMLALKIQVVLVFFFAGMGKLNYDWLFEGRPVSIWLTAAFQDFGLTIDFNQKYKGVALALSWLLILSDFIFPHFLLDRRTAAGAFRIFLIMQFISLILFPVGFFPVLFCVSCVVFLPSAGIHAFISRVSYFLYDVFQFRGDVFKPGGGYLLQYRNKKLVILMIGFFLAFQMGWPLVAYFRWGALKWADTVFHFSWNMELNEKSGLVRFWRVNRSDGSEAIIPLDSLLTPHQQKFMAQDPRMILQFANHLRTTIPEDFEIRAEFSLSMNGHQPFMVVEKSKDLFTQLEAYAPGISAK
jgi:hypothetical protein